MRAMSISIMLTTLFVGIFAGGRIKPINIDTALVLRIRGVFSKALCGAFQIRRNLAKNRKWISSTGEQDRAAERQGFVAANDFQVCIIIGGTLVLFH